MKIPPLQAAAADPTRFRKVFDLLEQAVSLRAFPGAAFSVLHHGQIVATGAVGRFTYDNASPAVAVDTSYDLASLTKPVATTAMAMLLYERGRLDLEAPVATVLRRFADGDAPKRSVTFRMLLTHTSGLPGYVPLYQKCSTREVLIAAAEALPLAAEPGTREEYSDIGFILLGAALERLAGERLDGFCKRDLFRELCMLNTLFCPVEDTVQQFPPTEDDKTFRHGVVQGAVHDENAWVMEGVAGHAGLFGNAPDLALFSACMLSGAPLLKPETIALFTRRDSSLPGATRTLGWDTPSQSSQAGRSFGARSYGHLGFTGTSLWIDPERELAVTLLSNRTWPSRDQGSAIKQLRPAFHDAVVEALE